MSCSSSASWTRLISASATESTWSSTSSSFRPSPPTSGAPTSSGACSTARSPKFGLGAAALYLLLPPVLLIGPIWGQVDSVLAFFLLLASSTSPGTADPGAVAFTLGSGEAPGGRRSSDPRVLDHAATAWSVRRPLRPCVALDRLPRRSGAALAGAIVAITVFVYSARREFATRWRGAWRHSGTRRLAVVRSQESVSPRSCSPVLPARAVGVHRPHAGLHRGLQGQLVLGLQLLEHVRLFDSGFKPDVTGIEPGEGATYGIDNRVWGIGLFAISMLAILVALRKKEGAGWLSLGAALSVLAFYMFVTRMHERYMFPVLLPLFAACFLIEAPSAMEGGPLGPLRRRWRWSTSSTSTTSICTTTTTV